LGRLLQILAIAVVALIGIAWLAWGASFSTFVQSTTLALALWGGAVYMLRQAKAQPLPSLEDVFQVDPRAPVLYLRAFNRESQFFIMGNAMAGEGNPPHDVAGIHDRVEQAWLRDHADPGAGAVLSFDALGEGFVLTTKGNWPQDFVGPIKAWIAERKKIGRWVASKCANSGRDIYMPKRVRVVLLRLSRQSEAAKRAWRHRRKLLWGLLLVAGAFALTVMIAMIFPGRWVDRWWAGCSSPCCWSWWQRSCRAGKRAGANGTVYCIMITPGGFQVPSPGGKRDGGGTLRGQYKRITR
jgi:hypothetical protein